VPLRETTFIERNVESWRELEAELERPRPDPDRVRHLYTSISDDLSYARTHYPNRSVRSYLNHKASQLALSLYRNETSGTGLRNFWTHTVPLELYTQRAALALAATIFLLCFLIGWWSGVEDPDFLGRVVGMGYVEETLENIERGDPMAIYKEGSRLGGTLGIAGNNLYVSMLCYVTGILGGLGTLVVLINNAIMVGAFQQFFFGQGVGWESVLGIWTHGTIEISCIVVAAGAGFVLAKGILWPGTLSRTRSFQLTALSGLRIMAGLAPLIILAAFIEGYLTRLTEMPTALRVIFLLVNAAFVLYYFIVRPYQVGRFEERDADDYGKLPPDRPLDWLPNVVLSNSRIFFDSLRNLFGSPGPLLVAALLALPFASVWVATIQPEKLDRYMVEIAVFFPKVKAALWSQSGAAMLVFGVLTLLVMPLLTYRLHARLPGGVPEGNLRFPTLVGLVIPWLILVVLAWIHGSIAWVSLPLLALWMRGISYADGNVIKGLRESFQFAFRNLARVTGLTAALSALLVVIGILVYSLWAQLVLPFIISNVPPALHEAINVTLIFDLATDFGLLSAGVLICTLAYGLQYHSLRELERAEGLSTRLSNAFAA